MVNKDQQRQLMGAYIRQQRRIADLSMRQVSAMVGISNPYLSQIERGLRAPSEAVAAGIATALGVEVDELYERDPAAPDAAGAGPGDADPPGELDVLTAIQAAQELTADQRTSLAEIYRSFVRSNESGPSGTSDPSDPGDD